MFSSSERVIFLYMAAVGTVEVKKIFRVLFGQVLAKLKRRILGRNNESAYFTHTKAVFITGHNSIRKALRHGIILIMRSLNLTEFTAVVSDFDDTILSNKSRISGEGLHERSRLDAARAVGMRRGELALAGLSDKDNAMAFEKSPVHSAEGAFWWTLTQTGVIEATETFDPHHPLIQELIAAKSLSYINLLETEAQEVPGAKDFFGRLHKKGFDRRLAIASTGHRADILRFFDANGFNSYFLPENVVAKEDTTNPKPDPESFRRAIESMGIPLEHASRVLAFEDDPRGIQAAKALGMHTCALTTRYSAEELLAQPVPPDFVATDFNEYATVFGL